jgi:hypothetical protein
MGSMPMLPGRGVSPQLSYFTFPLLGGDQGVVDKIFQHSYKNIILDRIDTV